ncbi:MAG: CGNR zinc finger domain-containing protein [Thermoanaerobaculia bacterium]
MAEKEKAERLDFLFLAGNTCLDFVNTRPLHKGHPVEQLGSFEDFVRWLTRSGRIDARAGAEALKRWGEGPEGAKITERARSFRETLRHMADGLVKGRGVSTEGLAAINFILAENDGSLRLERQGSGFRTRFAARPTQPISLLGAVAEAAAELLSKGDLRLIRRCGNPDCVLYFYDSTRNHRRQWCAMGTCGNLMKVRAFRKRHRKRA